jgi:hypothetical protein
MKDHRRTDCLSVPVNPCGRAPEPAAPAPFSSLTPIAAGPASGSSGGGGRKDPAGTRSRGQHDRACPASARTRGPIRPMPHEYPAAPRHRSLGSPELWAKMTYPINASAPAPRPATAPPVAAEAWGLAVRRVSVIRELAERRVVGLEAADAAASQLGVSRRQVYVLAGRWRAGGRGYRVGPAARHFQRRPRRQAASR